MKKILVLAVAVVVLFAPMVGATRVEAGGLDGFFNGNSPFERVLGAAGIGAAAGAVGGAILGKGVGPAKGALAGAAIGGVVQGILEITDNVPISCGSEPVYRAPNGALYCGGAGTAVAVPYGLPSVIVVPGGAFLDGYAEGRSHARADSEYRAAQYEEEARRLRAIADERERWAGYRAGRRW